MAATKAKLSLRPLADRVVVRPAGKDDEKILSSGIIIPDSVDKEKPVKGTVVAVGPGKFDEDGNRIPMSVTVGDTVLFSKYGYDEIKVDDTEYYILSESHILAIMN